MPQIEMATINDKNEPNIISKSKNGQKRRLSVAKDSKMHLEEI